MFSTNALAGSLAVGGIFVAIVYAVCQCGSHGEVLTSRGGDGDIGVAVATDVACTNELVAYLYLQLLEWVAALAVVYRRRLPTRAYGDGDTWFGVGAAMGVVIAGGVIAILG